MGFWYAGTETGDAQVSRLSCGGGGGGRTKKTVGGVEFRAEGGEGGVVSISKLRNNKQQSLGPEWSMSEVGTPPPHNLDKHHGLVESINNNNIPPSLPPLILPRILL